MKKTTTVLLSALSLCATAQLKKAALIGLSAYKNNVTYVGKTPPVTNAPTCLVPHGHFYTDSITFALVKLKIDSVLPLMGYRRLPDDSVIVTPAYNELARTIREPMRYQSAPTQEMPAKGFSYISWTGFGKINYAKDFFEIPASPDLIMVAQVNFDINISTVNSKDEAHVECEVLIKAFDKRNKKVFKLSQRFKNPDPVITKPSSATCWGREIVNDISDAQKYALIEALKKMDQELPQEIADVKEANDKALAKEQKNK